MYYLLLTIEEDIPEKNEQRYEVCSLDPGVRSFMTGYAPDGAEESIFELSSGDALEFLW